MNDAFLDMYQVLSRKLKRKCFKTFDEKNGKFFGVPTCRDFNLLPHYFNGIACLKNEV